MRSLPFVFAVCAAVACAIGACTEHGQSPGMTPDGPGEAVCMQQFDDAVVRTCSVASDCEVVNHDDCCGTVILGIASSNAGAFPGIEADLHQCSPCPPLGCAHQDVSEDGMTLHGNDKFAPVCNAGRCSSTVVPQ
jgi:hypothetical protein